MISTETIEYLIRTYGYWALFVGTFIEGETILMLGGLAAQMGYLDLSLVMVVSFFGSFAGDQCYFHLGRVRGRELLAKHPKWQARAEKIHRYLERYHNLIMIGFRFIYGIRILTPIVLAMNPRIKTGRFFIFNGIGALIWTIVVAGCGYLFGHALELIVKQVQHYQLAILIVLVLVGIGFWIRHIIKRKKNIQDKP